MKLLLQNLKMELHVDSLSSAVDPKTMRKSVTKGEDDKKKTTHKNSQFQGINLILDSVGGLYSALILT